MASNRVLVTSALPYVNNHPHLGNLIGCVLSADCYTRYRKQRGDDVLFICGSDEYGTATEKKARDEGVLPRELCDKYHNLHQEVYDWFQIEFDTYGRTSTPNPKDDTDWLQTQITHDIYSKLYENGYLIQQTVFQMYCLDCDTPLADRFIVGICPNCQAEDANGDQCDKCGRTFDATDLISPQCKGNPTHLLEERESNHVYLDLESLQPELEEILNYEGWSLNAIRETKNWLKMGLKPRCISRDLKWGTPVPVKDNLNIGDKVFYVWFDAPIGYISITANHTDWVNWWKGDGEIVHFIGKDNISFHSIMFKATLLGTKDGYNLNTRIACTDYLQYEGKKFSKSKGIGVFGLDAKESGIDSDFWRFYLLYSRPEKDDSNFVWEDFKGVANGFLVNLLSNYVNRTLNLLYKNFGSIGQPEIDHELIGELNDHILNYHQRMDAITLKQAARELMQMVTKANADLNKKEPWYLITGKTIKDETGKVIGKDEGFIDKDLAHGILSQHANIIWCIGSLIYPFTPTFTKKVNQMFGTEMKFIKEVEFPLVDHELQKPTIIYKRIKKDLFDELYQKFTPEE